MTHCQDPPPINKYSSWDNSDDLISFSEDLISISDEISSQNPNFKKQPSSFEAKQIEHPSRFTIRKERRKTTDLIDGKNVPSSSISLSNKANISSFPTDPNFLSKNSKIFHVTHVKKGPGSADDDFHSPSFMLTSAKMNKSFEVEVKITRSPPSSPPFAQNTSDYDELIDSFIM